MCSPMSTMSFGDSFVSRQIEGKGIGVIAIKDIQRGTLVIKEEPLLVIPWWVRHSVYPKNELEETLSRLLESLPEEKRCLFMSLSDCKAGEDEEKSELGIWRTNNFALGPTHSKCSNGVFSTIARFNHSCVPSAEFLWNEKEGKQEVRAIRDIKAGEEISLCYFTSQWQLEHASKRQQYLLDHYGFLCNCPACSYTGAHLEQDSKKRDMIKSLRSQFNELVYDFIDIDNDDEEDGTLLSESELSLDLQKAVDIGLQRLALMNELHLKCRARMDFCSELLEIANDCNASPLPIAKQGFQLASTLLGPHSHVAQKWRNKLNQFM